MRRALTLLFLAFCTFTAVAVASAQQLEAPRQLIGDELFEALTVDVQVTAEATIQLTGTGRGDELKANLYYIPTDAKEVTTIPDSTGTSPLQFAWKSVRAGTYTYQYDALVENFADRVRISEPIPYPYPVPPDVSGFLVPQEFTDTNAEIKALASTLAAGETDAARVVHKIASWTRTNIRYDLTSIAADATEKASWVYANREGVCDEMTALFISLSREAGIPARFVSGLAYTTLPDFPEPWQAHGWAEVWLPDYGWVPVDITYGEVFWLDATHIPMMRTIDAHSTAADYSLRARDLQLEPSSLETDVSVLTKSGSVQEPLKITVTPQYERTGSESGNIIITTIVNEAPYYVATDVSLAATRDTKIHDEQTKMILLPPKATRLVRWRVTMPRYDDGFEYTVPFGVHVQRAGQVEAKVRGSTRDVVYPLPPAEPQLADSGLAVRCTNPGTLYIGETVTVHCTSSGARVCADTCEQDEADLTFTATKLGASSVRVNATSGKTRGHALVTFVVVQRPDATINASVTAVQSLDDTAVLTFTVQSPGLTDVIVTVRGDHVAHEWNVPELKSREFALQFPAALLNAGENNLIITVTGNDKNGFAVTSTGGTNVYLPATTMQKVQLFFLHLFS